MSFDPQMAKLMVDLSGAAYLNESGAANKVAQLNLGDFKFFTAESTQAFTATGNSRSLLAFRGTESDNPVDWAKDAKFAPTPGELGGRVHSGFREALDEAWNQIEPVVTASGQGIWVTGHSLGAALATLAAARLVEAGQEVSGVYTFGQPRTGLGDFASAFNGRLGNETFRVINHIDLVTRVPLLTQRYRHVGRRMYFDASGSFFADASGWKIAWDDIKYRLAHFGSIKAIGIETHNMSEYVARIDSLP